MTQNPYKPPNASVEVAAEVAALSESDFVKAFVCFVVCALIAGVVGGAVIGGIIGAVWSMSGTPGPAFQVTITVFSGAVALILNYFVFRFFVTRFIVGKLRKSHQGENQ